jgi:tRNA modification GTPase
MPASTPAADTIVAVATGSAAAGIGVVRVSGPLAGQIARQWLGHAPQPRHAHFVRLWRATGEGLDEGELLDEGLVVFFPGPSSYTGEDVLEWQGHGNAWLLRDVVAACLAAGAREARAGEFTERAFLNGKLDLAQAEAVADLIAAGGAAATRAAQRSLNGEFSARAQALAEALAQLRVWLEAALDFPEEELDLLAAPELATRLANVVAMHATLLGDSRRGQRLRDGLHVVLAGAPNVGKSSLLNALAGAERAIVTATPGTTRDLVRETLALDGVQLTLVDTAGLRDGGDAIEREGMRRAREEQDRADLVLVVLDATQDATPEDATRQLPAVPPARVWLHNKCDLAGIEAHAENRAEARADGLHLWVSARTGAGLERLREVLREAAGAGAGAAGAFSARARHVVTLQHVGTHLEAAHAELAAGQGELAAERLRLAQQALGELTGETSGEDLLGRIFASFCIGK